MIGIPLGLVTANAAEWLIHKHVLHGAGRKKGSYWNFHYFEHHSASRRNQGRDEAYERSPLHWNAQGKELLGMVGLAVPVLALFPVAPFFSATLVWSGVDYYRKHKRSHLDPEWAREHLPWHYDHHMGPDQDANWCVTRPWFDHVMGTRKPYVGTEAETRDRVKRERALAARAASAQGAQATESVTPRVSRRTAPHLTNPL